ncbi:PAS domain S-box protein [Fulvivirgaceae bacterium BMA10]|uniref:histidine kinase n=1 Tax=Splendidivirga corallicola TaxID=3051826 RepID=A0ABT8KM51_9BACT|nr:PAS domain S-box protein [Fulvivirgaceae bacterium BMA10]
MNAFYRKTLGGSKTKDVYIGLQKKVNFSNAISTIAGVAIFIFFFVLYYYDLSIIAWVTLVLSIFQFMVPIFNKFQLYALARVWIIFIHNVIIFAYSTLFGPDTHLYIFYLITLVNPLIYFELKEYRLIIISYVVWFLFVILDIYFRVTPFGTFELSGNTTKILNLAGFPFAIIFLIYKFYFLVRENYRASVEINETNKNLENLIENTEDGIFSIDKNYRLLAINNSFLHDLRFSSGIEVKKGDNILKYLKTQNENFWSNILEDVIEGKQVKREWSYSNREDQSKVKEIHTYPITCNEGNVKGATVYSRDITQRATAQNSLKDLQAKYERAVKASQSGLWEFDVVNETIFVSNTFMEMLGIDVAPDQRDFEFWKKRMYPEDLENFIEAFYDHLEKSIPFNIECRIFSERDQCHKWFRSKGEASRDKNGKPLLFSGSIIDITSQKEAQESLKESKHLLESINRNIKEGLYRSHMKKGLVYVNDTFVELFGYCSKEEILKIKTDTLFADPSERAELFERIFKEKAYNVEIRFRKKDGSTFWGLLTAIITSDDNDNIFFDGAIRDITELREVQDNLKKLNIELLTRNKELSNHKEKLNAYNKELQSNKISLEKTLQELSDKNFELDQFVYKTSHDLRAPLRSILGLVNIMKSEESIENLQEYIQRIETSIYKLDDFVKSTLNYAKANRSELDFEIIDFNCLIQSCLTDLEYQDNYERMQVQVEVEENDEIFKSDYLRLHIIFSNIISNAFKYMDVKIKDNFLKINITIKEGNASISFKDNGIGIEKAYLEKVFQMFYRANERSEGSGLGLYIVKQSVEKLGGIIKIESQPRIGTDIDIRIPTHK